MYTSCTKRLNIDSVSFHCCTNFFCTNAFILSFIVVVSSSASDVLAAFQLVCCRGRAAPVSNGEQFSVYVATQIVHQLVICNAENRKLCCPRLRFSKEFCYDSQT